MPMDSGNNSSSAESFHASQAHNSTPHNQNYQVQQQPSLPPHPWMPPSGPPPDTHGLLYSGDGRSTPEYLNSQESRFASNVTGMHSGDQGSRTQDTYSIRDQSSSLVSSRRDHPLDLVGLSRAQQHEVANMLNTRASQDSTTELLPTDASKMAAGGLHAVKTGTGTSSTSSSYAANLDSLLEFVQYPIMSKTNSMLDLNSASDTSAAMEAPEDYRDQKKLMYRQALVAGPMEVSDEESLSRGERHSRDPYVAIVLAVFCALLAVTYTKTVPELLEGNLLVIPVIILVPIFLFFGSFAMQVTVFTAVSIFLGRVRLLKKNNAHYSYHKTPIPPGSKLPPVIIQMPVYKEGLEEVIIPTHTSVLRAVKRYQKAGGTASFLVSDDGLQVLNEEDAATRIAFYAKHQISFVARPPQNRRGLFKKASNMNYTLRLVDVIRQKMKEQPGIGCQEALAQVWKEFNSEFAAGGDIVIPDDAIILLIDADTRVPEGCILDTMGEFVSSPDLPYTQHFTQPFDEQKRNYWEQMISFFTEKIYFLGLMVPCAMGGYAPLVGHNAFLRWSSVKEASFMCPVEKIRKYWSEDTVSEDFDLFLRFASHNKYGRYVVYTGPEFQEGVSLSYIDEVIKLRKFAYGSCEMVFNPFKYWITKGPLTPLYKQFLFSKHINWPDKCTVTFYLSTYFAMGATFYVAIGEAVCSMFMPEYFGRYFIRGFDIFISNTFVFLIFATLGSIMITFRINTMNTKYRIPFIRIIWNEIKFAPLLTVFFCSILFHITTACFCYMFSVKIVWGATVKEVTNSSSAQEIRKTCEAYWLEFTFLGFLFAAYIAIIYLYDLQFFQWWSVLSYLVLQLVGPFLLNPNIMSITY